MCTPGLLPALSRLSTLTCTHRTHASNVGGAHDDNGWKSASHAAYPPDLNMLIANAVACRITMVVTDASLPPQSTSPGDVSDTHQRPNVTPPSLTTDGLPTSPTDTAQPETHVTDDNDLHQHFQRGLGAYPLRNRTPAALLTVRNS
eukprot:5645273-Pleurochrysis_carterae.AAC.2